MTMPKGSDRQFHDNLSAIGAQRSVPPGPSQDVRSRCLTEFDKVNNTIHKNSLGVLKRPTLLSGLGLAACLALMVGLLFPWNGGTTVQAATILAKLNEQMAEPELIELTLDSITIDGASVNGHIEMSETGVAGDLHVLVSEGVDRPVIEVDLSLGVSADDSWVLIRKLSIPEPEIQPILNMILPPGTETLLMLPPTMIADELDLDVLAELKELSSGKLVEAFQDLVESQPETGATITDQRDGTILMTLPIQDAAGLEALERLASDLARDKMDGSLKGKEPAGSKRRSNMAANASDVEEGGKKSEETGVVGDSDNELFGSTLSVVFDPEAELVTSFSITDFGETNGTISVVVSDGEVDPALFDPSRVTTPATRTFDLEALKSMFEQFGIDTRE